MRDTRCLAAAIAVACGSGAPLGAQSLDEILAPRDGTYACWQRTYSDAHLSSHPQQKVTQIRFGIAYHEMAHHAPTQGDYSFSVDIATRERTGSAGGLCQLDGGGAVICAIDCDGGAMRLRTARPEGSLLLSLESGGLSLSDCGSDTVFRLAAEPDDKLFLVHPAACP